MNFTSMKLTLQIKNIIKNEWSCKNKEIFALKHIARLVFCSKISRPSLCCGAQFLSSKLKLNGAMQQGKTLRAKLTLLILFWILCGKFQELPSWFQWPILIWFWIWYRHLRVMNFKILKGQMCLFWCSAGPYHILGK